MNGAAVALDIDFVSSHCQVVFVVVVRCRCVVVVVQVSSLEVGASAAAAGDVLSRFT